MIRDNRNWRVPIKGIDKVPPKIEEQDLRKQVKLLRKGDNEARQKIILGHIGMAGGIAGSYAARVQREPQDILGVALMGLCDGVEFIRQGRCKHEEYTKYLHVTVRGKIDWFLKNDYIVKPPVNNYFNPSMFVQLPDHLEAAQSKDLYTELIESPWFTTRESEIMRLSYEGYDLKEIAKKLGYSYQRISEVKRVLINQVKEWLKKNQ